MFFVMAAKHARSLTAYVETHAQIHDTWNLNLAVNVFIVVYLMLYSAGYSTAQHIKCVKVKSPVNFFLLWLLGDKGTDVSFCWIPSHCGI